MGTPTISTRQMRLLSPRKVNAPHPVSSGAGLWDWEALRNCALNQQATLPLMLVNARPSKHHVRGSSLQIFASLLFYGTCSLPLPHKIRMHSKATSFKKLSPKNWYAYVHNPWTQTIVWLGLGRGRSGEEEVNGGKQGPSVYFQQ